MKKAITFITVCALILMLICTLSGCSSETVATEKTAVCYVLANTANSQGLNLNSPMIQETVYKTIRNYGFIAVINADGEPQVVSLKSYDIDAGKKDADADKLDKEARNKTKALISHMQNVVACEPEVDYLTALNLAARTLSSLEGYDSKTIVVLGTGLSTSGVLDFRNNLISADPSAIVEWLREKEEIPDFDGITVYWQQMGDVAAPQQELTGAQRNALQTIYRGIVEAGGGKLVFNSIIANPVNQDIDYPPVTPVELPEDTTFPTEPSTEPTGPPPPGRVEIEFIENSAAYRDPEKAKEAIELIAEAYANNQLTILLCGTTAGDENSAFAMELSLNRAKTIKQTLIELGIEADRIIAVGLGSSAPWHISGAGESGPLAAENRKVMVLDAASELGQEILAEYKGTLG